MIDLETKQSISYDEYKKKITEGLMDDEEAVILLSEIYDLVNLNKDIKQTSTDLFTVIENINNQVAQKWNIPRDVFFRKRNREI